MVAGVQGAPARRGGRASSLFAYARDVALALALFLLPVAVSPAAAAPLAITDITGREVTLDAPARRIVLGAGRHILPIGLIHPDPASLIVGWRTDFLRDTASFADWAAASPELEDVAIIGSTSGTGLEVETILGLEPDLVILDLFDSETPATARSRQILEELGIPVIVVDFFSHPLENTLPSLAILGKVIGVEAEAERFAAFYTERLERVRSRIVEAGDLQRPRLFLHAHAGGMPCCATTGNGNFAGMIEIAGGHNMGSDLVSGPFGNVSLERLIVEDPDIYVATGGAHLAARGGLVLGPGVDAEEARASLDRLLSTPGLDQLSAVRDHHAFGVWHMFNDTPAHIVMIEWLATILHPDLFPDVDPAETVGTINRDFLAVPMTGTLWLNP